MRIGIGLGIGMGGGGGSPGLPGFASLVAMGDSITAGTAASDAAHRWVNILTTALGATLLNQGISGATLQNSNYTGAVPVTGNFRDRFIADMTGANLKSFASIAGGTNDARFLLFPATMNLANYQGDMAEMIVGLLQNGYTRQQILVLPPFWIPDNGNFGSGGDRTSYETFVTGAAATALEYGVYYMDIYAYMRDHGGAALIDVDLLHPNDAGHAVIAAGVRFATITNAKPVPTNLTVTSLAANGLDVSWTAPAGTITNYTVQYGTEGSYNFPNTQDVAGLTANWAGVAVNPRVRVRVRANFSDGSHSPWVVAASAYNVLAAYAFGTGPGWFDASLASSVTVVSGGVTALANRRVSGGDLTYGGTTNAVLVAAAAKNGLNALRLSRDVSSSAVVPRLIAPDTALVSTMFQGNDKAYTVICAFQPTDTNSGFIWSASDRIDAVNEENIALVRRSGAASSVRRQLLAGTANDVSWGAGEASGAAIVVAVKHSGTAVTVWDNSLTKAVTASAQDVNAFGATLKFMLFACEVHAAADPAFTTTQCSMDFYECVVENSALADGTVTQAITDMAAKWGITLV